MMHDDCISQHKSISISNCIFIIEEIKSKVLKRKRGKLETKTQGKRILSPINQTLATSISSILTLLSIIKYANTAI